MLHIFDVNNSQWLQSFDNLGQPLRIIALKYAYYTHTHKKNTTANEVNM